MRGLGRLLVLDEAVSERRGGCNMFEKLKTVRCDCDDTDKCEFIVPEKGGSYTLFTTNFRLHPPIETGSSGPLHDDLYQCVTFVVDVLWQRQHRYENGYHERYYPSLSAESLLMGRPPGFVFDATTCDDAGHEAVVYVRDAGSLHPYLSSRHLTLSDAEFLLKFGVPKRLEFVRGNIFRSRRSQYTMDWWAGVYR